MREDAAEAMREGGQPIDPTLTPKALLVIALLALVLGIGFRFYHLDRKVYWGDEVYSSLRMFGDTEADLVRHADSLTDAHQMWLVLHPTPSGGSSDPFAPAKVLAVEEAHHAPIYYEIAHFWTGAFGNSIATTRLLTALLSLLILPCAFWLAVELFRSRRAGWIAAALFALSPVGVLYAQQAREYALWTAALLALQAALLRALRLNRPAQWWQFGFLVAFALYVDPLTFVPLGGLALYVLITQWPEPGKLLRAALAFVAGSIVFVPWLFFLVRDLHAITGSLATTLHANLTPVQVVRAFFAALRLNFIDLNWVTSSRSGSLATAAALVVIVYAIFCTIWGRPRRVWLFLIVPLAVTCLTFLIPDILGGGQRVRNPRYFMPAFVDIDYCVTGVLAALIGAGKTLRIASGYALLIALLAARGVSCAASSKAVTWWSTQQDNSIAVARSINADPHPLLASEAYLIYDFVLANYLRPDVATVLRPTCYECENADVPKIAASDVPRSGYSTLFALGPSEQLQGVLAGVVAGHPQSSYKCINITNNCASDLNIWEVYTTPHQVRKP